MAATGSRVLVLRWVGSPAVTMSRCTCAPRFVLPEKGTWITKETPGMEKAIVSRISHKSDEAKVTVLGVENRPGVAARLFTALADRNLQVDTIIQNVSDVRGADVSFTVPLEELAALHTLEAMRGDLGYRELSSDDQIGKVTLVGAGMKSEPGVAAESACSPTRGSTSR